MQEFEFADGLGPAKVIQLYAPGVPLRAHLVVDNVAAGPAIGGVRMAPDVTLRECARLARAMTLKTAAAGLPHGGGKAVIAADPAQPPQAKERLMRAFATAIADLRDYIPGPDMGTDERCMAWVLDETGRAVGLPPELGGIPLDEIGVTGFGLSVAIEAAEPYGGVRIAGARVAVQGFGAVGRHAARFLAEKGAILVAAADSRTTVADPAGLDLAALAAHKAETGRLSGFPGAREGPADAVLDVPCDIWIPAARPDVLTAETVARLDTRLVAEGANIPATPEAEAALLARGVMVLPDFIANAGGVICAAVEYRGGGPAAAFAAVREKIAETVETVLAESARAATSPRAAAVAVAERRVRAAMALRRWH